MPDDRDFDEPDPDFEDEEDEVIDLEEEGEDEPTEEVGSEGGSPGESMSRSRARDRAPRGSEASETQPPSGGEGFVDRRDRGGRPVKQPPD